MNDQLVSLEEYHPSDYKNHCRQITISMGGNETKVQQGQSCRRSGGRLAKTESVSFRSAISPTLFEDDWTPFRDCLSL